jgi:transposase
MAKLRREQVMMASEMVARAVSVRRVATQLGVDESTLRYRLARAHDAPDGRCARATALAGWDARVDAVLTRFDDARVIADGSGHCETQMLHRLLVREQGFAGSYQAVRRYLRRRFPPMLQAIRRVETPPGVQAQHDWFDFAARIGGALQALHGLIGTLSHSRGRFIWVSPTMTQLAWQTGHLALFQRYQGVPLWIRLDNLKTAVAQGAGPTAVLTPAFAVFARECGFGVDPCRAATGSDKGKVERNVRSVRSDCADLLVHEWPSVAHLQAALDQRSQERHARERCPVTGTTIAVALAAERALLQPVPGLHDPFDCVVARRVTRDALVSFEGRRYSVPFAWIDRVVEVRGTAQQVVLLAEGVEIARHNRHTAARLVLVPSHYDGPSTASVRAPTPLGRRARAQLASLPGAARIARPLADYVLLLDATRTMAVTP